MFSEARRRLLAASGAAVSWTDHYLRRSAGHLAFTLCMGAELIALCGAWPSMQYIGMPDDGHGRTGTQPSSGWDWCCSSNSPRRLSSWALSLSHAAWPDSSTAGAGLLITCVSCGSTRSRNRFWVFSRCTVSRGTSHEATSHIDISSCAAAARDLVCLLFGPLLRGNAGRARLIAVRIVTADPFVSTVKRWLAR